MKMIFKRLFRRRSLSEEDREEIEAHIAMRAEAERQSGITPEEALGSARRQFGNPASVLERLYDYNGFGGLETVLKDLQYAIRGLQRNVAVSLTAIVTIAIGVSATTSMFGVIRNLMLAPPPHVTEPDRVFRLHQQFPPEETSTGAMEGWFNRGYSYPFFETVAGQAESTASVAAYGRGLDRAIDAGSNAATVRAVPVSAGFWRTLGVEPTLGRFMTDAEAHPATGRRAVVLGHAFWLSRFGGRADVIGDTLQIEAQPYEILGIAPEGFRGVELEEVDLWLPLFSSQDDAYLAEDWYIQTTGNLLLVVRLRDGVTAEGASAELTRLHRAFSEDTYAPRTNIPTLDAYRRSRTRLGSLTGGLGDDLQPIPEAQVAEWLFGVAFVLVAIAAANVAGLLLLRAMRRRREIAIRLALGVGRARLARQLLMEGLVLASIGGVAALFAVVWSGAWLQHMILPAVSWKHATLTDPGVLAVAGLSMLVCATLGSMTPLWFAQSKVLGALRNTSLSGLARQPRVQGILLVVQSALAIVLLIGAGLFLQSLWNVESLDIGWERDDSFVVQIDFGGTDRSVVSVADFFERALDTTASLPGVTAASLSRAMPLRDSWVSGPVRVPGQDEPLNPTRGSVIYVNYVTPGFFDATGLRIIEGRGFTEVDRNDGPVTVIDERLAREGWPDRSPVGECVYVFLRETCTTVVGVVTNALRFSIVADGARPHYYTPLTYDDPYPPRLLFRTAPGLGRIDQTLRESLLELDPALPYADIEPLGQALDPQIRPWRMGTSVFSAFGFLAASLALIGIWSSIAYSVSQRLHEFAIRRAMGAARRDLVWLVLGERLRTVVVSVVVGIVVTSAASPYIAGLLFRVSPLDPLTFSVAAGAMIIAALMASLHPAWRASQIHPADALRAD